MRYAIKTRKSPVPIGFIETCDGVGIDTIMNAFRDGALTLTLVKPVAAAEPAVAAEPPAPAAVESPQEGTAKETPKLYSKKGR